MFSYPCKAFFYTIKNPLCLVVVASYSDIRRPYGLDFLKNSHNPQEVGLSPTSTTKPIVERLPDHPILVPQKADSQEKRGEL